MRRWKYIIAAVVLAGLATAGYFAHVTRTASMSDEEWDICEAVLRHQIFNSAAGGRGTDTAYVEIGGRNPTGAFLDRFRGHQPPVKAGWRFSGGRGILYEIGGIKRTGKDSAEVYGGYYEVSLSASGNTYNVVRKDGKWVVERDEMHWISRAPNPPLQRTFGALKPLSVDANPGPNATEVDRSPAGKTMQGLRIGDLVWNGVIPCGVSICSLR